MRSATAAGTGSAARLGAALVVCLSLVACGVGDAHRGSAGPADPITGAGSGPMGAGTGMGMGTGTGMGMGTLVVANEAEFLVTMVAHHRDAVVAAAELERAPAPAMRRLGRRVVRDQSEQIELMQGWLARWYPGVGGSDYLPMMSDLSALSGAALERTFLVEMIRHHMAAVMMSRFFLSSGLALHPAVADLAGEIVRAQSAEIRWMRARLGGWGA